MVDTLEEAVMAADILVVVIMAVTAVDILVVAVAVVGEAAIMVAADAVTTGEAAQGVAVMQAKLLILQ